MIERLRQGLHRPVLFLVSAALLLAAVGLAGTDEVLREMQKFPLWVVAGVLALFGLNLAVVSFRLSRTLSHFGMPLPARVVTRASISGYVAGLFFISLFGQVVGRHLVLKRYGIPSVFLASLTAYERFVLLLVSSSLCLAGTGVLLDSLVVTRFLSSISFYEIVLASVAGLVLSLLLGRSRFEARLIAKGRSRQNVWNLIEISFITLFAQLLVLTAFVLGGLAFSADVGIWELLAAAAITSFAASLPITVNGWGVRELASVYTFGQLGMPSSTAIAISILVGLCSTAVILAVAPLVMRKTGDAAGVPEVATNSAGDVSDIEKIAVWLLATAGAVLIYFQLHVALPGGVVNLNLADPFAIIALAALLLHAISRRRIPRWRINAFNLLLAGFTLLLVFGFIRGAMEIGVTQWAFAGRLTGWLVIVGYAGIGYLLVQHMGNHGLRRFAETMMATAVVIIVLQMFLRWADFVGFINGISVTPRFEGYAGNRNAFAFQMITTSILMIAYSNLYDRADRSYACRHVHGAADSTDVFGVRFSVSGARVLLLSILHGFVIASIIFSGSRAGIITMVMVLFLAWLWRYASRRMLVLSVAFALFVWISYVWGLPLIADLFNLGTNPDLLRDIFVSRDISNKERWETITRGMGLWLGSPLLGTGLGVFIEKSQMWFNRPLVIHSTPVWILVEFGLIGLLIVMSIFFYVLYRAYRLSMKYPRYRLVVMLLLAFVVFGMVHEIVYQRIFWLVLGAALATSSIEQGRESQGVASATRPWRGIVAGWRTI